MIEPCWSRRRLALQAALLQVTSMTYDGRDMPRASTTSGDAVDQRAHSVADGVGHVAADGGDALLTGPFRLMRGVPAAG